jgi:hypothetical protein
MTAHKRLMLVFWSALIAVALLALPVSAGTTLLSNNAGDSSSVWFISGEPSLVMNGFDLTPLNLQLPAVIDRVSIAVDTPVPGTPIDVVVYQDANGGSPVDAQLVGRATVDITQTGVFTAVLPTPVQVTQPVVWVGFYLPVNFRFLADTSGSSVLTYWAWTNGTRFDVANLASAQVLGPADGTAPVNINMNGIARITAEISPAGATPGAQVTTVGGTPVATPSIVQAVGGDANLNIMVPYATCETLFFDGEDELITHGDRINLHCVEIWPGFAPPAPPGYVHRQLLYDLSIWTAHSIVTDALPFEVTHCIEPFPDDLPKAVVGLAYGAPRAWHILPTLRFGSLVCAEITRPGTLAYFIPAV